MTSTSLFSLKNKVSLVTGACGLLGKQHAMALSSHGSTVVLVDIDSENLEKLTKEVELASGENCLFFEGDVTDPHSIRNIRDALLKQGLSVNILVNNAAVNPSVTGHKLDIKFKLDNLDDFSQWDRELGVSIKGTWICSQIFGLDMVKAGGGSIINISSDLSVISPDQRLYSKYFPEIDLDNLKPITYSIAKTGLLGITRYLATLWAKSGVRVNAVSPGGVFNNQDPDFVERLEFLIPMSRMARVDEYRGVIVFLGSDASSYMTGQNIIVDGGRSIW